MLVSIYKHFGNGPQWKTVTDFIFKRNCEKNWWAALPHIQNYYDPAEAVSCVLNFIYKLCFFNELKLQCLQPSWYLSADFQLVLVSPLIMYPLYKWGWKVLSLLIAYMLGTEIYVFVIARQNDFKVRTIL